ncbi:hypothetical protein L2E82_51556 [Cichorium intybus]|nr:hypothetical protein L2E82_51556 [Cichorium intybus]
MLLLTLRCFSQFPSNKVCTSSDLHPPSLHFLFQSCGFTVRFKPKLHSFIETSAQELVLMVFSEIVDAEIFCN